MGELAGWSFCPRCREELRGDEHRVECPACGFVEEGEHPLEALRRELGEETGLEIEPLDFFGVWMDRYGGESTAQSTLNLIWTARATGGRPNPADDVSELRWFDVDELPPPQECAFEVVENVLSAWRTRHEH